MNKSPYIVLSDEEFQHFIARSIHPSPEALVLREQLLAELDMLKVRLYPDGSSEIDFDI